MLSSRYMSMNYPSIDIDTLNAVLTVAEKAAADPKYLNPENCPYDRATVKKINQLIETCQLNVREDDVDSPKAKKRGRPAKNQVQDLDEVNKELDDIRKELNQLKIDGKGLETSDRIQIIKTRAALFERIIVMKERVVNMKQQLAFINSVIGIMEDHMDQEQREAVMKELRPFAEGEA